MSIRIIVRRASCRLLAVAAFAVNVPLAMADSERFCSAYIDLFPLESMQGTELENASAAQRQDWDGPLEVVQQTACIEQGDVVAALERAMSVRPSLWATMGLIVHGRRDVADLVAQIPHSTLSQELQLGYLSSLRAAAPEAWLLAPTLAKRMHPALAWALTSDTPAIGQEAQRLLSRTGEPQAQQARVRELMACAEAGTELRCLEHGEGDTGQFPAIADHWERATTKQKIALAQWAAHNEENRQFLAAQLLSAEPWLQLAIFEGPLRDMPDGVMRLGLAKALLNQALEDPTRRPPAIKFDADADSRDGLLGYRAFGEAYPAGLDAAFGELLTLDDDDTRQLYRAFDQLDHPWLTTMAGMSRLNHEPDADALHLLRHVLDEDGLPALHVLEKIDRGPGLASYTPLVLAIVREGNAEKWELLSRLYAPRVELKGEVLSAVQQRVAELPQRIARMDLDLSLDAGVEARVEANKEVFAEIPASVEFARHLADIDAAAVATVGRELAASPQTIIQMIGITLLAHAGDPQAAELIDAFAEHPDPRMRESATEMAEIYVTRVHGPRGGENVPREREGN
ncbi:MAG: hypothetical protein WCZ65_12785 [Lysobacteraceae bacterium]